MRLQVSIFPLLLLLLAGQSPQDAIRKHYEAAERARQAGNLAGAEAEYGAILGEADAVLGKFRLAHEDYKRAIPLLEDAALYRRGSADVLVDLSIAYFGAEEYEKSVAASRKALTIDAQNPGAHQMLGKAFFMLGDMEKSIAELEAASRFAPGNIDVLYTLGIAYLRNRQPEAAKQLYESIIKQFGDQPELHMVIGRAYRQSGLLAEAAEEFKKTIALNPHFPRAHYYLGITYLLDGGQSKLDDASEEFKIEVAANPDEFFANYYLGIVYIYQRKWEQAIPFLRKASTSDPNNPDPYFQLGQAYQELGKHEQAIEVLRKAIALNPYLGYNKNQVTTAHHRLAQSLLKLGQTEAGQKELEVAAELKAQAFKLEQQQQGSGPEDRSARFSEKDTDASKISSVQHLIAESNGLDERTKQTLQSTETYYQKIVAVAHNNIGLLRAERQDFRSAAEQFAMAAQWDPEQEGLDYNLGLAYYKSEQYHRSLAPLEKELDSHPANRAAALLLGMSWFMLGHYSKAGDFLEASVDAQTSDANVLYALASCLIKQGKSVEADRLMDQLKTNDADSPLVHLLLAEMHGAKGETSQALAELSALSVRVDTLHVHYYAGLLYAKLNKVDEAIRELERALAVNSSNVSAKYYLGHLLLADEKSNRGLELMREIIQAEPEYADARYDLGSTLLRHGDFKGAIENLEIAVRLSPEAPEFHYQLGQAYIAAGRKMEGKSQVELANQLRNSALP